MVLRRLLKMTGFGSRSGADGDNGNEWGQPVGDPVEHAGCLIQATPRKDTGGWRVAGIITRVDGATPGAELDSSPDTAHRFVRVDVFPSQEAAAELSIVKGRQIVNEQGMRLFAAKPQTGG